MASDDVEPPATALARHITTRRRVVGVVEKGLAVGSHWIRYWSEPPVSASSRPSAVMLAAVPVALAAQPAHGAGVEAGQYEVPWMVDAPARSMPTVCQSTELYPPKRMSHRLRS